MIAAIIIFVLMYVGMLAFPKWRVAFTLGAAVLMTVFGIMPIKDFLPSIDWNIIMMIAGTMGIVSLFIETGMPARLADMLIRKVPDARIAIVALCAFSGIVSAFVDNVATVLMVAPIGLAICKKLKINPVPVIISIAVSSNLQGAATLVGDTTSILLGGYAGMSFIDFIWWNGKPSIFWAVELGALGTIFILLIIFRKYRQPVESEKLTEVTDYVPGIVLLMVIVSLIVASFFNIKGINDYKNGLICMAWLVIDIIYCCTTRKSVKPLKLISSEMDYQTLGMLCGLFVVIASIQNAGLIDMIADWFAGIGGKSGLFALYTLLVFGSVLISAFVDNIPYVAAMLPVVQGIGTALGVDPVVLYFGLLSGATLGGNITPFGASANITAIGILRKDGYEVKNSDFFKIGIPFTMTAVLIGYAFIWFFC